MIVKNMEEAVAFATDNDIHLAKDPIQDGEYIFLPVDSVKTSLGDFYTWNDIVVGEQPLREVWRPFLWMVSKRTGDSDVWGTNTYLNFLTCAPPNGTVFTVLETYFRQIGT